MVDDVDSHYDFPDNAEVDLKQRVDSSRKENVTSIAFCDNSENKIRTYMNAQKGRTDAMPTIKKVQYIKHSHSELRKFGVSTPRAGFNAHRT